MDKAAPPISFGVFKPVGHTVIAFHTPEALHTARKQLLALGFGGAAMVDYSAEEMLELTQAELHVASPLSNFGYEMDLLRLHHRLARQGCCFLVVHAPKSAQQGLVSGVMKALKPASAQHYGHLLIADLTELAPGSA